ERMAARCSASHWHCNRHRNIKRKDAEEQRRKANVDGGLQPAIRENPLSERGSPDPRSGAAPSPRCVSTSPRLCADLTMNRIRLLPEHVANQIAAGEVVERPASVVKELVENSLDAEAQRITVEIHSGGRSLIRVTDDGLGMSRDDALLCLERHATSKIQRAEDLHSIATMGFR